MTKVYEVYQCKYKGEVVYVGQGGKGRHKHCISGCSHVFKLNEIYFLEGVDVLSVEVLHYSNDKEAVLIAEKEYIKKHQPIFNSVFTRTFSRNEDANKGKETKKKFYGDYYLDVLKKNDKVKYSKLVEEFYDYFGYKNILSGEIELYGCVHYKGIGKNSIALLSRYVRGDGSKEKSENNPYMVFKRALHDIFDIDLTECLKYAMIDNIKKELRRD